MDIDPEKENLFNEVYDTEHIPAILEVPGVIHVERLKSQPMKMNFGGQVLDMDISKNQLIPQFIELKGRKFLRQASGARPSRLAGGQMKFVHTHQIGSLHYVK